METERTINVTCTLAALIFQVDSNASKSALDRTCGEVRRLLSLVGLLLRGRPLSLIVFLTLRRWVSVWEVNIFSKIMILRVVALGITIVVACSSDRWRVKTHTSVATSTSTNGKTRGDISGCNSNGVFVTVIASTWCWTRGSVGLNTKYSIGTKEQVLFLLRQQRRCIQEATGIDAGYIGASDIWHAIRWGR